MKPQICIAMTSWVLLLAIAALPACGGGTVAGVPVVIVPGGGGGANELSGLKLLAMGGEGTSGDGGNGNSFYVETYTGADVIFLEQGELDASFSAPAATPHLGSNPLVVGVDMTLLPEQNGDLLDLSLAAYTGLHVLPGVTLTLLGNVDLDNADSDGNPSTGTKERANVTFSDGVFLEGALAGRTDLASAGDGASDDGLHVVLEVTNFVSGSAAQVALAGVDQALGTEGSAGGSFSVSASDSLVNRAAVDTSGGDGDQGGQAGQVRFESENSSAFNLGTLTARGGLGLDGGGGDGALLRIYSYDGVCANSATLSCRGGDGTEGGGAGGEGIDFEVGDQGSIINSGDLDTSGGHATQDGDGGNAGWISFYFYGGPVRATGDYRARGGDGAGMGFGGDGNQLAIEGYDYYIYDLVTFEGAFVGADIDLCGGRGTVGGGAGDFYVYLDAIDSGSGTDPLKRDRQGLLLVGYSEINLSGGHGSENGGDAGGDNYVDLYAGYDYVNYYVGSIINEVPFVVRGGDGATGNGGNSTYFEFWTDDDEQYPWYDRMIRNTGSFDMRGGNGGVDGGSGGEIWWYDAHLVAALASINTSGGDGVTGSGGEAGPVEIFSDDLVSVEGDLRGDGGASTSGTGGSGSEIRVYGRGVTCVGAHTANGGNGGTGDGGSGGYIEIWSTIDGTDFHGSCALKAGTGASLGDIGDLWLDGIHAVLTGGVFSVP